MHIGFITPEYPHPDTINSAGLGTSIKSIACALIECDVKVSIFIYSQQVDKIIFENGIKIHFIKHKKFTVLGWYFHRKYLQNYLNRYIVIDSIDAIEAPDWTGISAFMKLKCILNIRIHGSDTYFCHLENRRIKKKNLFFEKKALKNAENLISVSSFAAKISKKLFKIEREITVIPNGIDTKIFLPQNERIKQNSILYFGTIIRKKGVLELAQIFNLLLKKNPDTFLNIVGKDTKDIITGTSTIDLMKSHLSIDALDKVSFKGEKNYSEVIDEIASANVIVLPSFAEAVPMSWLEAMSMQKAIVTSNIGWANELMINSKTGFTISPKDHANYADKINLLLNDTFLAIELGKAAREKVNKEFSINVIAQKNFKFYKAKIQKVNPN
jgi:L-malate glycosyltransferase